MTRLNKDSSERKGGQNRKEDAADPLKGMEGDVDFSEYGGHLSASF